jgi:hypothetical protein
MKSFEEFSNSITYSDEGAVIVTAQGAIILQNFKGQLSAADFLF